MATSKLQEYTARRLWRKFPHLKIKENYRPDWLSNGHGRLELDFYIPKLKVAIEVQGRQHYTYVPCFHSDYQDFLNQQKRDEYKRIVCSSRNIKLYEVSNEKEIKGAIREISGDSKRIECLKEDRSAFFANKSSLINTKYDKMFADIEKRREHLEEQKQKELDNIAQEWAIFYQNVRHNQIQISKALRAIKRAKER